MDYDRTRLLPTTTTPWTVIKDEGETPEDRERWDDWAATADIKRVWRDGDPMPAGWEILRQHGDKNWHGE